MQTNTDAAMDHVRYEALRTASHPTGLLSSISLLLLQRKAVAQQILYLIDVITPEQLNELNKIFDFYNAEIKRALGIL